MQIYLHHWIEPPNTAVSMVVIILDFPADVNPHTAILKYFGRESDLNSGCVFYFIKDGSNNDQQINKMILDAGWNQYHIL